MQKVAQGCAEVCGDVQRCTEVHRGVQRCMEGCAKVHEGVRNSAQKVCQQHRRVCTQCRRVRTCAQVVTPGDGVSGITRVEQHQNPSYECIKRGPAKWALATLENNMCNEGDKCRG